MKQPYPTDYLDELQDAALSYLRRHQAEHLGEQELFSRAVLHLVAAHNASQAAAENTVARAYGELRSSDNGRYLDISTSTNNTAVLIDQRSGLHYVVPVSVIFERLIDAPARRRLSLVKQSVH